MDNVEPAILPAADAEESTLPFKGIKDVLLDVDIPISAGLRRVLLDLDLELAGAPVCVYEKTLTNADRSVGQNRFLVPCKSAVIANFPLTKIFTRGEMAKVCEGDEDKDDGNRKKQKKKDGKKCRKKESNGAAERKMKYGLDVQAFDGEGRSYHVMCRYLGSNGAYRIKDLGWKGFLKKNGLLVREEVKPRRKNSTSPESAETKSETKEGQRRSSSAGEEPDGAPRDNVQMELWAFRSRRLTMGLIHQHDGALGLIFRHYRADQEVQVAAAAAAPEDGMETSLDNNGAETTPDVDEMDVDEPKVVAPEIEAEAALAGHFTPQELEAAQGLLMLSRCQPTGDRTGHGH